MRRSFLLLVPAVLLACNEDDPYAEHRTRCVDRINEFRATEGPGS